MINSLYYDKITKNIYIQTTIVKKFKAPEIKGKLELLIKRKYIPEMTEEHNLIELKIVPEEAKILMFISHNNIATISINENELDKLFEENNIKYDKDKKVVTITEEKNKNKCKGNIFNINNGTCIICEKRHI